MREVLPVTPISPFLSVSLFERQRSAIEFKNFALKFDHF